VTPIYLTSVQWITSFGGNAGVLSQAATEAKNDFPVQKCTLADLVCITGESHWQLRERLPQATAGMCVSQRWIFWTVYDNL